MWKKKTIAEQAAETLLEQIRQGSLRETLPGEHVLTERLNVSRGSLRAALKKLENDGIISVSKGKRRRINHNALPNHERLKVITILIPRELHDMGEPFNKLLFELRSHLRASATLNTLTSKAIKMQRPGRHLTKIVESTPSDCWILVQSSASTQQWFSKQSLPTLVLGSVTKDLTGPPIPSVDTDWTATGHHLAHQLLRRKHRHILFLERHIQAAGSIQLKAAYQSQLEQQDASIRHANPEHGALPILQKYFPNKQGQQPPFTCIVCYEHEDLLTTLTWLLAHGWRIPHDIELFCLDAASSIHQLYPTISHYRRNVRPLAKALARTSLQISQGLTPLPQQLYLQEFVPAP